MSSAKRILHVLAPAREGGLERVVEMLASGQDASAVHVAAVLTPDEAIGHPFVERLNHMSVAVTPLVVGRRNYLREYLALGALLTRFRPTVVHTHGYRADVMGAAVARVHGVPVVSTVHGFTGSGKHTRFYERVQCFALRSADAVIAVSRPLVNRLVSAGVSRTRIHCVPNGFTPPPSILTRSDARQMLGIQTGAVVAAWVGRLSPEKGADVMLHAIAKCDRVWRASIIGDGPERDRLRELAASLGISDRVTWHGSVSKAGSLLAAFDAFVLSSRTEGTPIALLEAMHAGVPIVATRVGGVPDVIGTAQGLLVPSEDPGSIAGALEEIRRQPAAATRRTVSAKENLVTSFSTPAWLAAVEKVYTRVEQNRSRAHWATRRSTTDPATETAR
ncbi:MAG TPA: glycosyltransferase family 4 protein [Gemmatimonadaceae bacterium]|nr:glycosyltransferase family 4 protein [Gemmatimonadaceae bacterium]